jgi:RNA polymerase sigma-70 factor (ECF subfamily)
VPFFQAWQKIQKPAPASGCLTGDRSNKKTTEDGMTSDEFAGRVTAMTGTLYRVSRTMLASNADREDAVAEAIRRAWEKRDSLRDEDYLQTWVIRILINVCRSAYRRRGREFPVESPPERASSGGGDPGLRQAVLKLPEALRLPIVLHYTEGYEIAEIARMLRLPSGTVKSRMRKARALLKQALSEEVEP